MDSGGSLDPPERLLCPCKPHPPAVKSSGSVQGKITNCGAQAARERKTQHETHTLSMQQLG
eukprot:6706856-Prymnesium_polylepis.1